MKIILALISLSVAVTLTAQAEEPKEQVTAAAKKLGEQSNYSWKTTTVVPESAQFKPGPIEGKTEKNGFTYFTMSFGDNLTEAVLKGEKGAVTNQDGEWQSASELEGGEGRGRFLGRMVKNFKAPAVQASELAAATKELKKDGDALVGSLTAEGAKAQFRFGNATDTEGSVKFWVKDGVLSKYEVKVKGKVDFNGNVNDVERTITTEIKDVGNTKVNVPTGAKSKVS
jgi:hypothetical protein